jgi:hypothetical protein
MVPTKCFMTLENRPFGRSQSQILTGSPQSEYKRDRFSGFAWENPGSKIRDRGIEIEFRHRMLWKFQNTLDAPFR